MVRETRHLWVGNLPDNVREDRIRDHFKRYGRVQSVKVVANGSGGVGGTGPSGECIGGSVGGAANTSGGVCAAVAFMDIKSAAKAHAVEQKLDERILTTVYYEPAAIPSASAGSSPASSQYSASSGSAGNNRYSETHRSSHQRWYNNYSTSPTTTGESAGVGSVTVENNTSSGRRRGRSGSSSGSGSSSRSVSSSSPARSASSSSSRASSPGADHRRKHQWSSSNSRPLAICVRNLPQRSSDSSLKDGLYHEYKKHGKVSCVKVVGVNQERCAVVYFKKSSDVEKALEMSQDKSFFGCKISVAPYQGMDVEDNESRPYETDLDEFHPKATRTLFIGNLEKDVTSTMLREKFKHFGKIIDIDIKKPSGGTLGYAFCQFASISSVVDAIRSMDGERIGESRVKLGFGKSMVTNCIWIDGVGDLSEKQVHTQCVRFGQVSQILVNSNSGSALVSFEQVTSAQQAVKELRGLNLRGRKLQVDFASRECQDAFYEQLQKCSNSNTGESRCNMDRFPEISSSRGFDINIGKYNRYDGSPRARQVSYSRSRNSRLLSQTSGEHFDGEFTEKRFRYDEFSGGSGSEAAYDIGSNAVTASPALQSVVVVSSTTPSNTAPPPPIAPNIRHLQKERVHLLEQLEECPSSGDELVSPKKRFKSERSSLGRRPSGEMNNRHHREVSPCVKRRRGSVTSRHHWHTPSPVSRPGTPLHDERPDSPVPTEPRRPIQLPRRTVPMCLPLPRFAAQVLARASQTSPPRAPLGPPPPASPTAQRVPSPASSTGSSPSPAEPSLDERIKSLEERYEKWSGSRSLVLSECPDRSRFRHHLLDLNDVQPSDVMRSVLAKRSVFDEDIKRLESICDKYDAPIRTTCAFPSPSGTRVSPSPLNSPQSAGRSPYAGSPIITTTKPVLPTVPPPATPAKGLQYPFPSHPPVVPASPLDSLPVSSQLLGDSAEEPSKNILPERHSVNHIDSVNIPRLNNISTCNDRVPVSVSFNSETISSSTTQTLVTSKSQMRNNNYKCDLKIKSSEHPSHKDCNLVNDHINECDNKHKFSNVNSDHLDRRKNENSDLNQIKSDSDISLKENRDQSVKQKISSEKSHSDKKISEKSLVCSVNSDRTFCDKKLYSLEKPLDSNEKRKNSKEECYKNFNDREFKRLENDRRKKDGMKFNTDSIEDTSKSIDRLQSNAVVDKFSKDNVDKEFNEKENFCRDHLSEKLEKEQIEKIDKDRYEKEKKEKDKLEKERLDKDRREKNKSDPIEKDHVDREIVDKDYKEKEKVDKERREKEKLEKDRKERDRADKERLEREKGHREKLESEKIEKDKFEKEKHDRSERIDSKSDKNDKHKEREKDLKKKEEKDVLDFNETLVSYKDKRREKDDHSNDNRHRHKDSHKKESNNERSDIKSKNHEAKSKDSNRKLSRDECSKEVTRKDSSDSVASRTSHDSTKFKDHENVLEVKDDFRYSSSNHKSSKNDHKNRHHDKEFSPKNCLKENSEFVKNDSLKNSSDKKEKSADISHSSENILKDKRLSLDDKQRHFSFDSQDEHRAHEKRKERLNSSCSLPAGIGLKRRVSSQESLEHDECKKPKLSTENRKLSERRDSRDSNKHFEKSRHSKSSKSSGSKISDDSNKSKDEKKTNRDDDRINKNKDIREKDTIEREYDRVNREKNDDSHTKAENEKERDIKEKLKFSEKIKNKKNLKDIDEDNFSDMEKERDRDRDREFLARLELRSSQEDEKQQALKKEMKEKKRLQQLQQIQQLQMQQNALQQQEEKKIKTEERKKEIKEKRISTERKSRDECIPLKTENIRKKTRKLTNSTDSSDSDEPKKHSIFDIIDDEPMYISMYDKVKARSCKNMQKQEEEKRQEKIKAKFSQLKQSRAKREEKKRSTSWDEDSDSDRDHKKLNSKSIIVSSSEDEFRRRHTTDSENDIDKFKLSEPKLSDVCDGESTDDAKNKLISRKNSRSRIMSDTSEDEAIKKALVKVEPSTFPNHNNQDFSMKNSKLSEKENIVEIKMELNDDMYDEKPNKNCLYYNTSPKSLLDDKKTLMNSENDLIKNEHYIKNEQIFKYNSKYCDEKYNLFSEETISDSTKNNSFPEIRKKHKKKQKKQKNYPSDDERIGMFEKSTNENIDYRGKLNSVKRRHSNKKDKKRDKLKLDDYNMFSDKAKIKKMKNNDHSDYINNFKRGEIMQDIFGSLSDDCDEKTQNHFPTIFDKHEDDNHKDDLLQSESFHLKEKNDHFFEKLNNKPENPKTIYSPIHIEDDVSKDVFKEEARKRKEKKKKERKLILKDDENSLDVDAAGKAIEANLCADAPEIKRTIEKIDLSTPVMDSDVFRFTDGDDSRESPNATATPKLCDQSKREIKEKKKKKKKNKEDRQNRKEHQHHHHHHHHREKSLDNDSKHNIEIYDSEFSNAFETEKIEVQPVIECKPTLPSPSLPRLTESPPPSNNALINTRISPVKEIVSPKINVSKSLDNRRISDKFIPGFGVDIDETISENAVKSISEFENPVIERKEDPTINRSLDCNNTRKIDDKIDEKPRAVISQEETEDAVAALLGESFGETFTDCYEENAQSPIQPIENTQADVPEVIAEEEAEEMRQAVQSLNASELEIKPDTPQSENDLQIDTDTDEADESKPENPISIKSIENESVDQPQSTPFYQSTSPVIEQRKSPILVNSSEQVINIDEKPGVDDSDDIKIINDDICPPIHSKGPENIEKNTPPTPSTVISKAWSLNHHPSKEETPQAATSSPTVIRDEKPMHMSASIIQLKPVTQPVNVTARSILTSSTKVPASYQVLNPMPRPNTIFNAHPPTIKTPDHIVYQRQPSIMISPRMNSDIILHSPKTPQGPEILPKGPNMTILTTGTPNLTASNVTSAPGLQQRSAGPITVVKVQQQSPLSPIQTSHLPVGHQNRSLLSPGHNAVIIQNQNSSVHLNRLAMAPSLSPIQKPPHNINLQQPKPIIQSSNNNATIQHPKIISPCEIRKSEANITQDNTLLNNSKIILSTPVSSQNPTVMVQNILTTPVFNQNNSNPGLVASHMLNKTSVNTPSVYSDKTNELVCFNNNNFDQSRNQPYTTNLNVTESSGHVNNSVQTSTPHVTKAAVTLSQDTGNLSKPVQPLNNITSGVLQRFVTPTSVSKIVQVERENDNTTISSLGNISRTQNTDTADSFNSNDSNPKEKPSLNVPPKSNIMENVLEEDNKKSISSDVKPFVEEKNVVNEISTVNTVPIEKPKCETDFEELLKQTAITKVEKPVSINTDVSLLEKNDIKVESSEEKEASVQNENEQNKNDNPEKDLSRGSECKEETDSWSAKEVNIDSVIKKVDALCENNEVIKPESPENLDNSEKNIEDSNDLDQKDEFDQDPEKMNSRGVYAKRGGRARGRKIQDRISQRVQTRQGTKTKGLTFVSSKRGRGRTKVDKKLKPVSAIDTTNIRGDVYDFHEDSGDEVANCPQNKGEPRPRLIVTIKNAVVNNVSGGNSHTFTSVSTKENAVATKNLSTSPVQSIKDDKSEELQSPASNTRKSRRLQEKDVTKNSVDDVIEDVVKNSNNNRTGVVTKDNGPIRRSTRQNTGKLVVNEKVNTDIRKSPRASKKMKDVKIPEVSDGVIEKISKKDDAEIIESEKSPKTPENNVTVKLEQLSNEQISSETSVISKKEENIQPKHVPEKFVEPETVESTPKVTPVEQIREPISVITSTAESNKNVEKSTDAITNAATTPRIDVPENKLVNENSEELMIDPVTGEMVYMRHSSDGNFVPVSNAPSVQSNSRVIIEPKVSPPVVLPKLQVETTVISSAPVSSVATSVVKTFPSNIHINQSRTQSVVTSQNAIATTSTITCSQQNTLSENKPVQSLMTTSTVLTSANKVIQSIIPTSAPVHMISNPNNGLPKPIEIVMQSPVNPSIPSAKICSVSSVNMTKSNIVTTIPGKPIITQPNTQNVQLTLKSGQVMAVPVPLNKLTNPSSPTKIQQNLPPKLPPGQQLKPLIVQPQIAHPPQKQIQAIHIQHGALGPGSIGPSLPRGAQGQHGSPPLLMTKHMNIVSSQPIIAGANSSRVSLTAVPSVSPQGQVALHADTLGSRSPPPAHQQTSPVTPGEGVYSHFAHQQHYPPQYFRTHQEARTTPSPYVARSPHGAEGSEAPSPPLELRRLPCARVPHPAHSPSLSDRSTDSPQVYSVTRPSSRAYMDNPGVPTESTSNRYYESSAPPPAHISRVHAPCIPPSSHHTRMVMDSATYSISKMPSAQTPGMGINIGGSIGEERGPSRGNAPAQGGVSQTQSPPGPPHASHAPREADSLMMLLRRYPVMWQGLLALKNDAAAVQMHFVHGNPAVAGQTLPSNGDGSTPPLRIAQRMRLEPVQLEAVARKMQMENEHCMLLALPCGRDHLDVLQQSTHLSGGFITYLKRKQAAGIVNVAPPGHHQALFTVHIFPSCDFANENLERIAPDLLHRVADIAHLLIVIATV